MEKLLGFTGLVRLSKPFMYIVSTMKNIAIIRKYIFCSKRCEDDIFTAIFTENPAVTCFPGTDKELPLEGKGKCDAGFLAAKALPLP